jgi:arylsulfatase A-like enzyme
VPHRALARTGWCVALLALLPLLGVTACSRPAPDVIVILVDTLRADRVGSRRPGLTPFLDSLAATGVTFSNAYSSTSWTNPAVASLFTSRYPSQHHVSTYESVLTADEVTLAERLHAQGYRSLGVVANFRLLERFGFNRGFDLWVTRTGPASEAGKVSAKRVAKDTFSLYDYWFAPTRYSRWLRRRRPVLLYLHFMEPHAPYDPPAHVRTRIAGPPPPGVDDAVANAKIVDIQRWDELSPQEVARLEALYDAEVADLDARLARLFDGLRRRGLLDHAIVVFTADHGEEFREHGGLQHGNTLYQESVRIPLIVVGPGVPAGRVVTDRVSLLDIAPTILDLAGLPPEPRFEGQSLTSHFAGARSADIVLQLLPTGQKVDVRRHAAGLVHDDAKLLVPPKDSGRAPELYDLNTDPHETRSNPPSIAAQAPTLESLLATRDASLATRAGTAERGTLSEAERARLRALGYAD